MHCQCYSYFSYDLCNNNNISLNDSCLLPMLPREDDRVSVNRIYSAILPGGNFEDTTHLIRVAVKLTLCLQNKYPHIFIFHVILINSKYEGQTFLMPSSQREYWGPGKLNNLPKSICEKSATPACWLKLSIQCSLLILLLFWMEFHPWFSCDNRGSDNLSWLFSKVKD